MALRRCNVKSAKFRRASLAGDRTGLRDPEPVERVQDDILGAYKRYIAEKRPTQPVHWAKVLMKVTDLRTISTRHAERVLCIKLDSPGELPPLFLEMFDEGCCTPCGEKAPAYRSPAERTHSTAVRYPPAPLPLSASAHAPLPNLLKLVPAPECQPEAVRRNSVTSRPSSVASTESVLSSLSSSSSSCDGGAPTDSGL